MELEKFLVPVAIVIVAVSIFVSAGNKSENFKTITTTGEASIKVAPNKADVSFGIGTEADTASSSQNQNREVSNRIMQAISDFGIVPEDVKTTQLTVEPVRDYNPVTGKFEDKGFRTTHTITVTARESQLDRIGELVDSVVGAGANRVESLVFSLDESTEKEMKKQLLDDAASEAKNKADAIASGLGSRIVGVRSASESSFSIVPFLAEAKVGSTGSTQIATGQVDISASVSVSFEIA